MDSASIFEYFGLQSDSKCGYCKVDGSDKCSHGMWSHALNAQDYQDLLDRGWRRSGKYCYKPVMNKTCCPQYTIRSRTLEFALSRSQRRVLKCVNNYLKTGKVRNKYKKQSKESVKDKDCEMNEAAASKVPETDVPDNLPQIPTDKQEPEQTSSTEKPPAIQQSNPAALRPPRPIKNGGAGDPPEGSEGIRGKEKRRKIKHERLRKKGIDPANNPKGRTKGLTDYLAEVENLPSDSLAHRLELRLVQVDSKEFDETFQSVHDVYYAYQTVIHKDPPTKPTQRQFTRFLCSTSIPLRLVRVGSDDFRREASASYGVFKTYQMSIHGDTEDEASMRMYLNFLVETPLKPYGDVADFPGYGSFHHQYYLDGKLVAVGVIDILPKCVSSKYLFYDPAYEFLNLGTYSALREIALVQNLAKIEPRLKYYYMGYYIHDCQKMKYKGAYYPSDLCCPETYAWFPIDHCRPLLDATKYARFDPSDKGVDHEKEVPVGEVGVLFNRSAMLYKKYRRLNPDANDNTEVKEYARFTGKLVAYRALLYRKGQDLE